METIISVLHSLRRTLRNTFGRERSKKIREEAREIVGREEAKLAFFDEEKERGFSYISGFSFCDGFDDGYEGKERKLYPYSNERLNEEYQRAFDGGKNSR